MHNLKKKSLTIYRDQKIFEVINKISLSKIKILFVIDKSQKLLGSVTSGDIRRALRKKIDQNLNVEKIMCRNPKFLLKKNKNMINKHELICLPILNKNKRIIDFQISEQVLRNKKENTIFLMAGGKGARLLPLTKNTPKPLLKIKKIPIIEKIIINFREQGFYNFIISVNYLGFKIKNYLGNGTKLKVNITYIDEKKFLGTAGSLSLIDVKKIVSPFIVANSDLITEIDYKNLIDYHNDKKSDLTICAKNKIFKMPYGEILLKNSKVKKIVEKPISNHLVNAGIYVFNKSLIKNFTKNKKVMMNDFITDQLKKNKNIFSYPVYESWVDIGNKSDFYNSR